MDFILSAVIVLGGIALVAAVILYVCSKKFAVYEDPRLALSLRLCLVQIVVVAAIPAVPVWLMPW